MRSRTAPSLTTLLAGSGLWGLALTFIVSGGCSHLAFNAVDQAAAHSTERQGVPAIQVPPGFRAVRVVEGLTYPSSMTWDGDGHLYVLESHTVPIPTLAPRILRVDPSGVFSEVELAGDAAPTGGAAIGLTFHDGWLYLSHEEKDGTWGISRVRPAGGTVEAVLRGLPGNGDHNVNYLVFDATGGLYFGVGSATNSGVVSSHDPVNAKWLAKRPSVHDVPCAQLVLTGQSFREKDARPEAPAEEATTGAYAAYGTTGETRVPAQALCTGAVYRLPPGSTTPELVAWGFRNPVALALDPQGKLLVGMQGADIRGTRPVLDDPDAVYRVHQGAWYGWPDYSAALLPFSDPRYLPPAEFLAAGHTGVEAVIDLAASGLKAPDPHWLLTATDPHAAICGMTVVPHGGPFAAWAGQLLVSEMGDFRPTTDAAHPDRRAGFQVEVVNLATGRRDVFARNRGPAPSRPASQLDLEDGFERPVDVKVGPDGLVYVLDFGVFEPTSSAEKVLPKTGKVFRIEPVG